MGDNVHDPEVVAFHIRRPWPQRSHNPNPNRRPWRWYPPFVTVAGCEFYFPDLITIWHREPRGEDALRGQCRGVEHWRWHIHHWRIQWCFLQRWRRRLLTRCAWCGGRHTKADPINTGTGGWDSEDRNPWWKGKSDIVHGDCYSVWSAHRLCLCDSPGLNNGDYGQCVFCGKFRAWRQTPTIPQHYLASLPVGARIPAEKLGWLEAEWSKVRAERETT